MQQEGSAHPVFREAKSMWHNTSFALGRFKTSSAPEHLLTKPVVNALHEVGIDMIHTLDSNEGAVRYVVWIPDAVMVSQSHDTRLRGASLGPRSALLVRYTENPVIIAEGNGYLYAVLADLPSLIARDGIVNSVVDRLVAKGVPSRAMSVRALFPGPVSYKVIPRIDPVTRVNNQPLIDTIEGRSMSVEWRNDVVAVDLEMLITERLAERGVARAWSTFHAFGYNMSTRDLFVVMRKH